ncbi:DNA-3-methyladenine glycosylase [Fodinicola feengrottensis]|uniref:DNA-3-methyladenine glycosylase II n=1 Tax=Fodinicola feengrottensis TaxID=435914 RepID=A0ABP4V6N3_9ACTN
MDVRMTLGSMVRGGADPCHRYATDGSLWRTSRMPAGPATFRLTQRGLHEVTCEAWGLGAEEVVASLPDMLGGRDDPAGFDPRHPLLRDAYARHPGLRVPRTGRVMEALIPAILEQKITGKQAHSAFRWLLRKYGDAAPGPAPAGMVVMPTSEQWRHIPSWDWHRAGVEPPQSRTVVTCARVANRLEECVGLPMEDAYRRMRSIPGVGLWTAAEVASRALGDADSLSVGDYHTCKIVGYALTGKPLDDDGMVELLESWRPHRYRVVRLLELTPAAHPPRRGPRMTIQDHRRH